MRGQIPRTFLVIEPELVTDATLASSTVPEPGPLDPAAWVSGAAYVVGNRCHRAATHRIYECSANVTSATAPESDTAHWTEIEATQGWKMFDPLRTTPTVHASPLVVELEPGVRCNAWFAGYVDAQMLTVTMLDGATTVYSKTVTMTRRNTHSWSDYFFGTFDPVKNAMDDAMPLISSATIRFEFTSTTGSVTVGKLVVGRSVRLGASEVGAEIDADNYSRIERSDIDGTASLTKRRNVPRTAQTVWFNPADTDILLSLRDSLNATPAVWSALGGQQGTNYFNAFVIYGIYKRFRISADGQTTARLNLELEEM